MTTAKEHEFLCDNEEQLCSQTRPVAYLQHMKFGNEVVISDKTSVPFSGTVTIEKPQDVDTTLNPDFDDMQPLYLTGATVCLGLRSEKVGSKSSGSNCVTTNRQGEYILVGLVMNTGILCLTCLSKAQMSTLVFYFESLQPWV